MFENKKVIIFDMDGTLIDSVGIWNTVDEILIEKIRNDNKTDIKDIQLGRDRILNEFKTCKNPYMQYCRFLKDFYQSTLSAEEIQTLRYEIAANFLEKKIDYKKDADVLIKKLKEQNFTLVIASTTKRKNMDVYRYKNQNIISKAKIDDYFSLIFTHEDAKAIKPDPEIYEKVIKVLGVDKKDCLVFEDSLVGITAAKAAGLDTVAVYDKHSDLQREQINALCDYRISFFSELI